MPHAGNTVTVPPDPLDTGAVTGTAMRQTFRVETPFSNVVFAAPSPVSVQTDKVVQERTDGTLTSFTGFGKGATYTVTSRSLLPTAAALRAANGRPIPDAVENEFGSQSQQVTERVQTARPPDHRRRAHCLRQSARHRGLARHAREVLDRRAARAARASTSSTTSCSGHASAGANRSRAASS